MTFGINGQLYDAIAKSRVLFGREPRSVDVVLTPNCELLVSFFEALTPTKNVQINRDVKSWNSHGEQTEWNNDSIVDCSYPKYPDRWIINFVESLHNLKRIEESDWFGVWAELLIGVGPPLRNRIFIGRIENARCFVNTLKLEFPCVEVVLWDVDKDVRANIRLAAECATRIVGFNEEMAALSSVGLECVVLNAPTAYSCRSRVFGMPRAKVCNRNALMGVIRRSFERKSLSASGAYRVAIGIPTLCCGDLLKEAISVVRPQLEPGDGIFIVDNGKQELTELTDSVITVIECERNLGVSGSWNRLIQKALFGPDAFEWIVLMNDDITLHRGQWKEIKQRLMLATAAGSWFLVGPYFWSVFAINRDCIEKVGWFDENFYPAYFEDNDYHHRIALVDSSKYVGMVTEMEPEIRRNSISVTRQPDISRFEKNRRYFLQKWGGLPGGTLFDNPFNGTEPSF